MEVMPDFTVLGIGGVLGAVLFYILLEERKFNATLIEKILHLLEQYTKLLVDLTVALEGLKRVIEAQEALLRQRDRDDRHA